MATSEIGDWQPIATAPRDGTRVLIVIRASEQGPGAVDVACWARSQSAGEPCWIADDSDPSCQIIYAEPEALYWMPLPVDVPQQRAAVLASPLPAPPDLSEREGSGI